MAEITYQMVLSTFQTMGLLVGIFYYITTLRNAEKNRKIATTNTVMQYFASEESVKLWMELMQMKWTDLDDFKEKYDSRNNPENYEKRVALWYRCDNIGYLYKAKVIDINTVLNIGGLHVEVIWAKFRHIITSFRGTDFSCNAFKNWEHLAEVIREKRRERNDTWAFVDSLWEGSEYR